MNHEMKKPHFKKCESGYHSSAITILSQWVGGEAEKPFYVDGSIVFVPDVTVYKNGILDCIYEVVRSHPLTAKKYGLIQYWCYKNFCDLTVYEISTDYILAQTEKPEYLRTMECYTVSLLEYEDELLLKSIS
jgi:hypothetical protein